MAGRGERASGAGAAAAWPGLLGLLGLRGLRRHWPLQAEDSIVVAVLAAGWLALFAPTYLDLARTVWSRDEQGHGPLILLLSLVLLWRRAAQIAALPSRCDTLPAAALLIAAALMMVVGRSQAVLTLQALAQLAVLAALLLAFKGTPALRLTWFVFLFAMFMVPLPATWVAWVTTPLKSAVSAVAAQVLAAADYPVGRSGVILSVGPYQLLVADACAGLNSMFTLEALGLLYLQIAAHPKAWRNVVLALAIPPLAFVANVIRVVALVLVTYHFGDAAGQGFVHDMAGFVLFAAALSLVLLLDAGLGLSERAWPRRRTLTRALAVAFARTGVVSGQGGGHG